MESLKTLSFEALTVPSPASGYSVFLAACAEGNVDEVRNILSFSPSLLDTLIVLKTPALERAAPEYADKTPTEIVLELGSPSHQAIQETFQRKTEGMENVCLIHLAARVGSVRHIRKLASMGVELNQISPNRRDEFSTPLCLAAAYNKIEVVEELISHGAKLRKKDFKRFNAAHFAAKKGNTENLMYLLDIDSEMKTTRFCRNANLLHLAARGGHTVTVEALINIGLDVNEKIRHHWWINDEDEVETESDSHHSFEIDERADLFSFDIFSWSATPLMLAAKSGNIETVEHLISKGATIQAQDTSDCSALFYACNGGHLLMTKFLIRNYLDVNCCDAFNNTLLHVVTDVETAKMLISEYGLKLNVNDHGKRTPLHCAAERGDVKLAKYLMQCGADINANNSSKRNPLAVALCQKQCKLEMVSLLLDGGSSVDMDVIFPSYRFHAICLSPGIVKLLIDASGNSVNTKICGKTLLHLLSGSNLEASRFLVEDGANVNMQDDEGKLPLHVAAEGGNVNIVRFLLEQESEVDATDDGGSTPLLVAAKHGNAEASMLLLIHSSNIYVTNQNLDTTLHMGARRGLVKVVQSLLNFETFQKQMSACGQMKEEFLQSLLLKRNGYGRTALHEAVQMNTDTETIEILLAHGSDVNAKDDGGRTALHVAAFYGKLETTELLIKNGSQINAVDFENRTVLHSAVHSRDFATISFVIGHGGCHSLNSANNKGNIPLHDVNAKDDGGRTALHVAALYGQLETMELLIKHGSQINAVDFENRTVLHSAVHSQDFATISFVIGHGGCHSLNSANNKGNTPLHVAFNTFYAEEEITKLIRLFLDNGCNVLATNNCGRTALHLAASQMRYGSDEDNSVTSVLKLLIEAGSDSTAVDRNGKTALHHAARISPRNCLDILECELNSTNDCQKLEKSPKSSSLHIRDAKGRTPLHETAASSYRECDHEGIIPLLLDHGCDVQATDHDGQTPLHIAAANRNEDVARVLIDHGADVNAADKNGNTPLHIAARKQYQEHFDLMVQHGADVNKRNKKGEPARIG